MSPYVGYLLLRNLPYTLNPLRPARSRYRGIKWGGVEPGTLCSQSLRLNSQDKTWNGFLCDTDWNSYA
ncbi:hypothetical protein H8356DRAFT_1338725 [Neocallimastix lanati (nom. inval.)]|nr:hypothetical protein H8356DRAFT_1338725 [Neocallimastix sp. JGI-2020a]